MNEFEFYVKNFNYLNNTEDIDISFVPAIQRRRMSSLDKATLSVLNKTFSDEVQNVIFSSQYGQEDRLVRLIDQYTNNNEVSPNVFTCSVHNYSVGFFVRDRQKTITYNALSAHENSIFAGLLACVISDYDNNLFCYSDTSEGIIKSLGLNISNKGSDNSEKYKITINSNDFSEDIFEDYVKLFDGGIDVLKTSKYTIERVKQ